MYLLLKQMLGKRKIKTEIARRRLFVTYLGIKHHGAPPYCCLCWTFISYMCRSAARVDLLGPFRHRLSDLYHS